jgi:hypothetical protein
LLASDTAIVTQMPEQSGRTATFGIPPAPNDIEDRGIVESVTVEPRRHAPSMQCRNYGQRMLCRRPLVSLHRNMFGEMPKRSPGEITAGSADRTIGPI